MPLGSVPGLVTGALKGQTEPRVGGQKRLAKGLDPRARKLEPGISIADGGHVATATSRVEPFCIGRMKERVAILLHRRPKPRPAAKRVLWKLAVQQLEPCNGLMLEQLKGLRLELCQ